MTSLRPSIMDLWIASIDPSRLKDPLARQELEQIVSLYKIHDGTTYPDVLDVSRGEPAERLHLEADALAEAVSISMPDPPLQQVTPALMQAGARLFTLQNGALAKSFMAFHRGSTYHLINAAVQAKFTRFDQVVLLVPAQHWDGFSQLSESIYGRIEVAPSYETVEACILDILRRQGVAVESLTQAEVEAMARQHIAAIVTAIPNNPTGEIPKPMALRAFANAAARYQIPIISDEIMARTIHPGADFISPGDMVVQLDGRRFDMNRLVMRVTSNSKTGDAPYGAQLSVAMSGDNGWLAAMMSMLPQTVGQGFAELAAIYPLHTPEDYYVSRAQEYAVHAEWISRHMQRLNATYGDDLLQWLVPPQAGYLGAIRFDASRLAACGVDTPVKLIEYVVQVAGLKAGLVFPDASRPDLLAMRVNFNDEGQTRDMLSRLEGIAQAVAGGVSYESVRLQPKTLAPENHAMPDDASAAFRLNGGSAHSRSMGC
ncbi:MAG: aminotransferase class I/II-fold pyridoxal phosphate-dependent enzyme [Alphaproteobacteria bacterium]|nr:aminotransferase class I/II-fold pyridoxal phosphate-dependent enzyme [Alphaproteobacteria bacterium]